MAFAQNNTTDGGAADAAAIEQADIDHAERLKTDAEYRDKITLEQVRRIKDIVASMEAAMTESQQPPDSILGSLGITDMPLQTAATLTGVGHLETAIKVLRELTDLARDVA